MYNKSLAFIISRCEAHHFSICCDMGGNAASITLVDGYWLLSDEPMRISCHNTVLLATNSNSIYYSSISSIKMAVST